MNFSKKIIIIALLISIYQLKAQPISPITTPITAYLPAELTQIGDYVLIDTTDPIEPDYTNDQFIKGGCDSNYIDLGGGCILEYNYYYRLAGNTFHDIYISSFNFKGSGCHIGESSFVADEYNLIIQLIMSHIMMNCNPWFFDIPPCEENTTLPIWRLGHPSCLSDPHWVYDPVNNWFFHAVTSCKLNNQTNICWHIVNFCWKYENGFPILYQNTLSPGVSSYTCPTFLENYPGINCYPICDIGGWGGE